MHDYTLIKSKQIFNTIIMHMIMVFKNERQRKKAKKCKQVADTKNVLGFCQIKESLVPHYR